LDTLDDASFPRKGFRGELNGRVTGTTFGAPNSAAMGGVSVLGAFSSENHTVRLKGEFANNINDPSENSYLQRMGDF
jgi:hypothetical protein